MNEQQRKKEVGIWGERLLGNQETKKFKSNGKDIGNN